jgi:hypothetical protein
MVRGKSRRFADVNSDLAGMFTAVAGDGGSTKAIDAITERPES